MTIEYPLQQFAWLFTRGDDSVYLRVEPMLDAYRLTVSGPRAAQTVHDFHDAEALKMFVADYQQQLESNGFQLHAKAERRASPRPLPLDQRQTH